MFLSCMVDWSRFAGSLWDGILAPHVSTDTITDKVATFDAAIVDYLGDTFQASKSEFQPPQRYPYISMSFDNLRAIARRAAMVSSNFDRAAVPYCGTLAMDTLDHVQAYKECTRYPLSCILPHHVVPSLASSLLLLCSNFAFNLGELDLPLNSGLVAVHQNFETTVNLLHDLAREVPLALRVLKDFERILPVVQAVLAKWSTESQLLHGPIGWSMMEDLIPSNVTELLPYQNQVPDISSPTLDGKSWVDNGGRRDLEYSGADWDESFAPYRAENDVLWV